MSPFRWLAPLLAAPTVIDVPTSRRLCALVEAKNRMCYINALRALFHLTNATYVEGFVVLRIGTRLEHAWLETPRGVVDPSPSYVAMAQGDRTYFPGPRWSAAEITSLADAQEDGLPTPVLEYGTKDGPQREAWIEAALASFSHCSAALLELTGQPAVTPDQESDCLDALLGCFLASRVREKAVKTHLS